MLQKCTGKFGQCFHVARAADVHTHLLRIVVVSTCWNTVSLSACCQIISSTSCSKCSTQLAQTKRVKLLSFSCEFVIILILCLLHFFSELTLPGSVLCQPATLPPAPLSPSLLSLEPPRVSFHAPSQHLCESPPLCPGRATSQRQSSSPFLAYASSHFQ